MSSSDAALTLGGIAVGVFVLTKLAKRPPHTVNTTRETEPGLGDPNVGGVKLGGYTDVYVAQRTRAFEEFGSTGTRGADTLEVPVTPVRYAVVEVTEFWISEINRLLGLGGAGSGGFLSIDEGTDTQVSALSDGPTNMNPAFYDGIVSIESANAILKAWRKYRARVFEGGLLGLHGDPMPPADAAAFWDATGRLAIAVEVDRAVPDFTGVHYAWQAIVGSAKELPGRIGEYARDVGAAVGGFALSALWGVFTGFATSPLGLAVLGGALYFYRDEIGRMAKRLTP